MGSLLGLGKVPLKVFWISSCCCFQCLLNLPVRCLMEHFHFGIVLLGLLVRLPGHVAALFHAGVGSAADAEAQYGHGGSLVLVG